MLNYSNKMLLRQAKDFMNNIYHTLSILVDVDLCASYLTSHTLHDLVIKKKKNMTCHQRNKCVVLNHKPNNLFLSFSENAIFVKIISKIFQISNNMVHYV